MRLCDCVIVNAVVPAFSLTFLFVRCYLFVCCVVMIGITDVVAPLQAQALALLLFKAWNSNNNHINNSNHNHTSKRLTVFGKQEQNTTCKIT